MEPQTYKQRLLDNDSGPKQIPTETKLIMIPVRNRSEIYLTITIQVSVQAKATTIIYLCWFWYRQQQQQQQIEEKYMEEMLLARILKIQFGEECSSVYYITIRVLLFYDDTKKRKRDMNCWRRNVHRTKKYESNVWYHSLIGYTTKGLILIRIYLLFDPFCWLYPLFVNY